MLYNFDTEVLNNILFYMECQLPSPVIIEYNDKVISVLELKKAFNEYLKEKGFTHTADKAIQWNIFWDKVKGRVK